MISPLTGPFVQHGLTKSVFYNSLKSVSAAAGATAPPTLSASDSAEIPASKRHQSTDATANSVQETPLKRLVASSRICSDLSIAYGQCVGKTYMDVRKGMCDKEFQAFKECVMTQMGRKW